jgi:hypothetical protein
MESAVRRSHVEPVILAQIQRCLNRFYRPCMISCAACPEETQTANPSVPLESVAALRVRRQLVSLGLHRKAATRRVLLSKIMAILAFMAIPG